MTRAISIQQARREADDRAALLRKGVQPKNRTNKYSAERCTVDGIKFDSKHEARQYLFLKGEEKAGRIRDLELQVPIMLEGQRGPILSETGRQRRLTIDFRYFDVAAGLVVYRDAKGVLTKDYEIRKSIAQAMGYFIIEA